MPTNDSNADQIIADAEALLAKVQRDLDEGAEFFRAHQIDPAKVLPALDVHMGAKEKQDLQKAIDADQADIQREVDEGLARLRFAAPATGGAPKRPRTMV